jgi:capsular exopolysaccharide synthesis family protein
METKKSFQNKENNVIKEITFKFLPYWPLFVLLFIVSIGSSVVYLHYATPLYQISASMLIKDEKKGADDSKMMESLNIYTSNKIVENEIEVIHSRRLMTQVVNNLGLYAPISYKGKVKTTSAYTTSPISIRVKNPAELEGNSLPTNIFFSYDHESKLVKIDNKTYKLNEWVNTPYGTLNFIINPASDRPSNNSYYFSLVSPRQVVNQVLGYLDVYSASRLSTVIYLDYKDEIPKRGEDILNELVKVYNNAAIEEQNSLAANTLSFVDERLKYVGKELSSVEKQIQQYKAQKGVVNLSQQGSLYLQNVGENDQKLATIKMQSEILDQVETYVNSSNNNTGIIPSTLGIQDPVLSNLLQKLYDAEINYNKLKKTVPENNPIITSLQNEIDKIRPNILENIRIQKIGLNTSLSNLNSTNQKYSSILEAIPQKERGLLEINRQQAVLNNVYAFLLQKREEAELSYASTVVHSRPVDFAESSDTPVSPKKIIILLAAFTFFPGIGVVIVVFREFLSRKVLFRSEIEESTDIPVLSEIFHTKKGNGFIINKENNTLYHQFRQLRTVLGLYKKNLSKRLLITSSISGEGKSFISTNLSITLAASGKKTVLLDLDFRNPKISRTFEVEDQIGIIEYLEGGIEPYEIIKATQYDNLFVIAAGSLTSEEATEKISNGKLEELFRYLNDIFEVIIVDSPPVEPVSDSYILSQYVDNTVFVVRHRYTPKAVIKSLDGNNKVKDLKISCIVFNDVKPRGFFNRTYGYGYGYGYNSNYKYSYSKS